MTEEIVGKTTHGREELPGGFYLALDSALVFLEGTDGARGLCDELFESTLCGFYFSLYLVCVPLLVLEPLFPLFELHC